MKKLTCKNLRQKTASEFINNRQLIQTFNVSPYVKCFVSTVNLWIMVAAYSTILYTFFAFQLTKLTTVKTFANAQYS
jgi:hypothetical protein